jgi:hypothetical protein
MAGGHRLLAAVAALLASAASAGADDGGSAPEAGSAPAPTAPIAAAAATETKTETAAEAPPPRARRIDISGYVQPQFGVRYRPGAVPRDRTDYSAEQTRTGLIVEGNPIPAWRYTLHVVVGAELVGAVTEAESVDRDGDGEPDEVSFLSRASTGIALERAAIDWDPLENVGISVGQMRIPLTVENQISNTALMFPNRAAPGEIFLGGSDLGALGRLSARGDRLRVAAGVFNGTDPTSAIEESARGPLYAVRADVDPMGPMLGGGRDTERGTLRVGFGAGVLYYPSTTFDAAGFEGAQLRDLRASLSARAAARGFYLQGEILRRQRTDSLSSRPLVATGAYGQGSYYVPIAEGMAISPMARLGWIAEDQSFEPRETLWTEAGASLHLRTDRQSPDDLRLTLQYLGERRLTERETAHGAVAQLQLRW